MRHRPSLLRRQAETHMMGASAIRTLLTRLTPAGVALLYAAFAALWVIASGYLLTIAVSDPLLQSRIELVKGLVFVAVTGVLLYLLLKGWHEPLDADRARGATAQAGEIAPPRNFRMALVFVALILVVPLVGLSVVKIHIPQEEQEAYRNLEAIAKLKEDEIKNWLDERRGDSEVLAGDDAFVERVARFLRQEQDAELSKLILDRFDKLRSNSHYTKILLFDPDGRLLLSSGGDVTAPALPSLLRQAIVSKQIQRRDIYRDEEGDIHLEWVIPLVVSGAQGKRAVAIVVLRVTAQRFIYPLIQSWPSASASAETLLVRRDGESVLFLNKLRHSEAEPMNLRKPLSATKLPAAAAIRVNQPGTVHGRDYRGTEVLAAYRPVAGTDWHIVAKIDLGEVLKPMWEMVHWITLIAFAAIAAIMAALLLLWRQQQRAQRLVLAVRSAAATEESERRFRAIAQSANDAIITADSNGNVAGWNSSAERLFGYTEGEIGGQSLTRLMPERFRDLHRTGMARVVAGGKMHMTGKTVELAGLRKDGSEFPLELSLAQWEVAAGQFFTATIRDITERKQSEEALCASQTRYISLFSAIADATYVHTTLEDGTPGKFLDANEAACRQTGYTRDELLGMTPMQLDAPDSGVDLAPVSRRLLGGELAIFEQTHLAKDGRRIPVEIHAHLFMLSGKQTVISIARDITERKRFAEQQAMEYRHIAEINTQLTEANQQLKRAQNQLLQAEKMAAIGNLAAGVAHEINNPIGYVNSNMGTLEKYLADIFSVIDKYEAAGILLDNDNPLLEELRQFVKNINLGYIREDTKALIAESQHGLERVKKIVLDLKNFSRVDTEEHWEHADLHKGMDATLNVVWNELKYKCEVVKEYGSLPEIYCLPAQLGQVFLNLLLNAAQAIEVRGKVTIRTGQEGDRVWVEVSDTGTGIPPENIPRLFEPFFTTKPVGKGTGLGLSVSYNIVTKHHGEIGVKSEVGKGSTFRVWLPVQQPVSDGTA